MIRNHSRHGSRFPIATAAASDPYWAYVSMLLHGDGTNAAQNNTFLDGSTNNFTVTRNGNTTQGSFNPFVSTYPYAVATNGGSGYFDGTGDGLTVPASIALRLGLGDFTIECWMYGGSSVSTGTLIGQNDSNGVAPSFQITRGTTGIITATIYIATTGYQVTSSTSSSSVWNHVAFVRNSNNIRVYLNGVQNNAALAVTGSVDIATGAVGVGQWGDNSSYFNGYISNARMVIGTCLYTSGTTFTPPTAPLTAVTNTALLLGMSNGAIFDNTMLNNLETVGTAQISTSVFKYGTGALKFNGTMDYLVTSPANQAAFAFGSGDFTIEMWVYTSNLAAYQTLLDTRSADTTSAYGFFIDNAGKPAWYDASGFQTSSTALTSNTWTHVAAVRTSGVLKLFLAGVQVYSAANTNLQNPTGTAIVGRNIANTVFFNGYIDDLRVTKGIARYTTTFTPPTAAFPNS